MDAIKILGSLLSSGALSGGSAGNVLGNILGSALGGSSTSRQGGGMADVLGSLLGGAQNNSNQGGLGDVLGGLLGGQTNRQNPTGLNDVLGSLLGGGQSANSNSSQGGLGNVLGSLLGGAQQPSTGQSGGLGDLLGGLMGGQQTQAGQGQASGGLADLLTAAVSKYMQGQNPNVPDLSSQLIPNQQAAEQQASLMIRAMINAAKADGTIDPQEQERIISKLGNISDSEADFIRREFEAPLNVAGFVQSIPQGMGQAIYAISLAAIDLDSRTEAQYLSQLAQGLNLSPTTCNALHEQVGAPKLYS